MADVTGPRRFGRSRGVLLIALVLAAVAALVVYWSSRDRAREDHVGPAFDSAVAQWPSEAPIVADPVPARAAVQPDPAPPTVVVAKEPSPEPRTANATIRLLSAGEPMRQGRVVLTPYGGTSFASDVDRGIGEARFTGIQPYTYAIDLEQIPEGWVISRAMARERHRDRGGRSITVEPGENRLDLELEAGAVIVGVVFDEKGWPEQNGFVRIHSLEDRDRSVPQHSFEMSNGTFRTHVHAGASMIEIMSTRSPDDRVPPLPQRVDLAVGARADLDFRFEAGTETLVARIVDETGAPFAGLKVGLNRMVPAVQDVGSSTLPTTIRQGLRFTKSDADGRFTFKHLPRGTCTVHIEEEGYSPLGGPKYSIVGRVPRTRYAELPRTEPDPWTIVVERAYPVLVRGKVLLKTKGEVNTIHVVIPTGDRREREDRRDIRVEYDGSFQFHVNGGETGAAIEVKHAGRVVRIPLAVTPQSGGPFLEIPLP